MMQLQSELTNPNKYIFIIGYDGHYEESKEVLHIVANKKDLEIVKGWFVDHKIVDEPAAREHIRMSKNPSSPYEIANLNYMDSEVFERTHTQLELIFSATKNEINWKGDKL